MSTRNSQTNVPSDAVMAAWVALIRAHRVALGSVEAALKERGFPPLAWYDVLLELDRTNGGELRLAELETRLLLTQYGVSRLVSRLEKENLLDRRVSSEDGRGRVAVITDAGRDLRKRMWPVYAAAVQKAIGVPLGDADAAMVGRLLSTVAAPNSIPSEAFGATPRRESDR